jgi:hypothetical protein
MEKPTQRAGKMEWLEKSLEVGCSKVIHSSQARKQLELAGRIAHLETVEHPLGLLAKS